MVFPLLTMEHLQAHSSFYKIRGTEDGVCKNSFISIIKKHNCILVLGGRDLQNSFILTQIKDCMVVMWDEGTLLGKCEKYTKTNSSFIAKSITYTEKSIKCTS